MGRARRGRPTYRAAGVNADLAAGLIQKFIDRFPACDLLPKNYFCQLVKVPESIASRPHYLSLSTDGVGTKILLGIQTGILEGLGQDLVGMIYNDLITSGSKPFAFLDYHATGKLQPAVYNTVIASIVSACRACGMPLLGGETAEMPGMYAARHFDLAGFGVGWVKAEDVLSPSRVRPGHILVGFPSSGFHSNGFSLVRKVLAGRSIRLNERHRFFGARRTLKEFLMEPTRLYTSLIDRISRKQIAVSALAHITGGGYFENVPRSIPSDCSIVLNRISFETESAELFHWFSKRAGLAWDDMLRVFNCGFGMVAICEKKEFPRIRSYFPDAAEVGRVEDNAGTERVRLV